MRSKSILRFMRMDAARIRSAAYLALWPCHPALLEFFETSTRNLLAVEAEAGVGHHVTLAQGAHDRWSRGCTVCWFEQVRADL